MLRKITLDELIGRLADDLQGRGDRGRPRRAGDHRAARRRERARLALAARSGHRLQRPSDHRRRRGHGPRPLRHDLLRAHRRRSSPRAITAAILEALQEAADSGRDFKMLYPRPAELRPQPAARRRRRERVDARRRRRRISPTIRDVGGEVLVLASCCASPTCCCATTRR